MHLHRCALKINKLQKKNALFTMQNQRKTMHKDSAIEDISFEEVRPTSPLVARADAILQQAKPTTSPIARRIVGALPKPNLQATKQVFGALVVAFAYCAFWAVVGLFWAIIKLLNLVIELCKSTVMGKPDQPIEETTTEAKANVSVNVSVNVEIK
jgi:hypothetical protein